MRMDRRLVVNAALGSLLALTLTGCPKIHPKAGSTDVYGDDDQIVGTVPVAVYVPKPGDEADYLREVAVYVVIDSDHRIRAVADPEDPNVVCGIPRVFYPPGGDGPAMERPEYPARQVRWIVRCEGRRDCLDDGERIVIRAKNPARPDRGCRVEKRETCDMLEASLSAIAERRDMKLDDYKAAKAKVEAAQQLTLFSPETLGTYVIFGTEGGTRFDQGSVTSGIPNAPNFQAIGPDLGWHYNIELWQGDERVDCLDPDVWVEDDSGGGPVGG